ncbi:hypothetical protein BRD02_12170 [Halobacteriales archaeon QS_8_69_73]|nr:MAG: hypothetical protein BRD02_12170 [Halobacteriales archaeon QS_8_69_73]
MTSSTYVPSERATGASPSAAASEGHTVRVASKSAADSVETARRRPRRRVVGADARPLRRRRGDRDDGRWLQGTEAVVAFLERNAPGRVETVAER